MEGELKARLHRMLTTKVGWLLNDHCVHHPFQLLVSGAPLCITVMCFFMECMSLYGYRWIDVARIIVSSKKTKDIAMVFDSQGLCIQISTKQLESGDAGQHVRHHVWFRSNGTKQFRKRLRLKVQEGMFIYW